MIRVLIVEDDFRVADINKKMTERLQGFTVAGTVGTGTKALEFLQTNQVDLVLLDVFLPDIPGIQVLKAIRKRELPIDCILVTAAHDTQTIQEALRYGIVDYLIKPIDMERYHRALRVYQEQKETLKKSAELNQGEVDQVRTGGTPLEPADLPKGISAPTLEKVKEAALSILPSPFTLEQMAKAVVLSKITAHRYLEHLRQTGVLDKEFRYNKIGRPTALYFKKR